MGGRIETFLGADDLGAVGPGLRIGLRALAGALRSGEGQSSQAETPAPASVVESAVRASSLGGGPPSGGRLEGDERSHAPPLWEHSMRR